MTKEQFLTKYNISNSMIYHYKKRFPHCTKDRTVDYDLLDSEIMRREDIKFKVQEIAQDLKSKDLAFLYEGKYTQIKGSQFLNRIYRQNDQVIYPETTYKKFLKIIDKFGEAQ